MKRETHDHIMAAVPLMVQALEVFVLYMEHAGDKTVTRKSLAYPLHLAEAALRKLEGEQ